MVQPLTFGYTTPVRTRRKASRPVPTMDSVCSPLCAGARAALVRGITPAAVKHLLSAVVAVAILALGLATVRAASRLFAAPAVAVVAPLTIHVTVAPGESLWSLSRRYGNANLNIQDRIEALAQANAMRSGTPLIAGQRLLVPVTSPTELARLQAHLASR